MGLFDFIRKKKAETDYYEMFLYEKTKADQYYSTGFVLGRKISTDELNDILYKARTYHVKWLESLYDFTTVEGVRNIPVPKEKAPVSGGTPCYNLEYVLRLKATEYKKSNIDLSIACLRKANEISPFSGVAYGEKDYMRVVEYLKDSGRFEEARQEETFIRNAYLSDSTPNREKSFSGCYDKESPFFGSDLIESTDDPFVCAECAKYTKRRFSEYGENPNYPVLPEYFKKNLPEHKHCTIHFHPVIEESSPAWEFTGDIVKYSNRQYIDERTEEEKQRFEKEVAKRDRAEIVKAEFDWLREFFPETAPKSLSGYSKMKNLKSDKYTEIETLAREKGKTLIE